MIAMNGLFTAKSYDMPVFIAALRGEVGIAASTWLRWPRGVEQSESEGEQTFIALLGVTSE